VEFLRLRAERWRYARNPKAGSRTPPTMPEALK